MPRLPLMIFRGHFSRLLCLPWLRACAHARNMPRHAAMLLRLRHDAAVFYDVVCYTSCRCRHGFRCRALSMMRRCRQRVLRRYDSARLAICRVEATPA